MSACRRRAGDSAVSPFAHNVASEADVDRVLEEAVQAGATLVKPGQKVFWGGYSGYFADPDGHLGKSRTIRSRRSTPMAE